MCSVYHEDSCETMNKHLIQHGDGVRDIAFTVDDATAIYDYSIKNGAASVQPPTKI